MYCNFVLIDYSFLELFPDPEREKIENQVYKYYLSPEYYKILSMSV